MFFQRLTLLSPGEEREKEGEDGTEEREIYTKQERVYTKQEDTVGRGSQWFLSLTCS